MSETCQFCRFWEPDFRERVEWRDGDCRRRAPILDVKVCGSSDTRFPHTNAKGFCGEFERVKEGEI